MNKRLYISPRCEVVELGAEGGYMLNASVRDEEGNRLLDSGGSSEVNEIDEAEINRGNDWELW